MQSNNFLCDPEIVLFHFFILLLSVEVLYSVSRFMTEKEEGVLFLFEGRYE